MKRLTIVLTGLVLTGLVFSGAAWAGPSTYAELGYISGGENGENGAGEEDGFEVAGSYAFNDTWYAGGAIGSYDRDDSNTSNDYLNINGGRVIPLTERTDLTGELGLWLGEQKSPGDKTKPRSLEFKGAINTTITDKFAIFASISLITGDLDTQGNNDLRNFVWSAGGAYTFTPNFSLSLKIIEGSNGVNGQSDVFRVGGRWTF